MKHFKLIGPETTREFDIENDEMITSTIIKIDDYQNTTFVSQYKPCEEQNIKIYPTEKE